MFCKNCGTQLKDRELFCSNCGTKQEKTKEKESPISFESNAQKNKTKMKIVISVVLILIAVFSVIALKNSGEVYGQWVVSDKSINENLRNYPEDDFVIYENGSFTGDGISGTYFLNNDTITFNFSIFGSYTYEYDVSGKTLMLRNIDDENEPKIYYDRVS